MSTCSKLYIVVPDGSTAHVTSTSTTPQVLFTAEWQKSGGQPELIAHDKLFNKTVQRTIRRPNRYAMRVFVTFTDEEEHTVSVGAKVLRPDGTKHSVEKTCEVKNAGAGNHLCVFDFYTRPEDA